MVGGRTFIDTVDAAYVWEIPNYPAWYFPVGALDGAQLHERGVAEHPLGLGKCTEYDIEVGERFLEAAAWSHPEAEGTELEGHVRLEWNAVDAWFEEDERVTVHPRDPYTRVQILPSSREVRVLVDGVEVARTARPRILFESRLRPRYYIPPEDVRSERLVVSGTRTQCPYKGVASYWSVDSGERLHADLVWSYPDPLPESRAIAGFMCFFDERAELKVEPASQ